jgi:hypothetical protein
VTATDYKGSRDVQVPTGCNPNGPGHDTWPKGQKRRCSTKTNSRCPILLTIPVDSWCISTWDKLHWKGFLLNFPWTPRTPQLDVVCDLGISFNVDSSWTSWTLDIEFFSAILVESEFGWTWDQFHWKGYFVLSPCIYRMSKSNFVCVMYINLKARWSWTPS